MVHGANRIDAAPTSSEYRPEFAGAKDIIAPLSESPSLTAIGPLAMTSPEIVNEDVIVTTRGER